MHKDDRVRHIIQNASVRWQELSWAIVDGDLDKVARIMTVVAELLLEAVKLIDERKAAIELPSSSENAI